MKDWHVGQRIVCLSDLNRISSQCGMQGPLKNKIYTIRSIEVRVCPKYPTPTLTLLLNEIMNPNRLLTNGTIGEMSFDSRDFRPLDESRLDQFRVHLNPKKVEEKIDA